MNPIDCWLEQHLTKCPFSVDIISTYQRPMPVSQQAYDELLLSLMEQGHNIMEDIVSNGRDLLMWPDMVKLFEDSIHSTAPHWNMNYVRIKALEEVHVLYLLCTKRHKDNLNRINLNIFSLRHVLPHQPKDIVSDVHAFFLKEDRVCDDYSAIIEAQRTNFLKQLRAPFVALKNITQGLNPDDFQTMQQIADAVTNESTTFDATKADHILRMTRSLMELKFPLEPIPEGEEPQEFAPLAAAKIREILKLEKSGRPETLAWPYIQCEIPQRETPNPSDLRAKLRNKLRR